MVPNGIFPSWLHFSEAGEQILANSLIATYDGICETSFSVYRAKYLYSSWTSEEARRLVMCARQSYRRYGPVPLSDEYDAKSEIYLAHASYTMTFGTTNYSLHEWLSMRFVPADGMPKYTEDLSLCICRGKTLADWLCEPKEGGEEHGGRGIVTLSRICGIPPYLTNDKSQNIRLGIPTKLRYTPVLFALMNKLFCDRATSLSTKYLYITGLFRDELIEKVLTVTTPNAVRVPLFIFADELFNLRDDDAIRIDRSSPTQSVYKFPAYFLRMDQLQTAIKDLLSLGLLSMNTLVYYMGSEVFDETCMDNEEHFRNNAMYLGNLLTACGPLYDASLTGEDLRAFVDARVEDGPHLYMMPLDVWQKSIRECLAVYGLA